MAIVNRGSLTHPYVVDTAPTSGASGIFNGEAEKGAQLIDNSTGIRYTNTGTLASPTWSRVPTTDAAIVDGAAAAVVADDNVIGGLPVLHRIDIADAASGDADVVLTHKTRVIDVWVVKRGGGGHATEDTVTVKNGTSAITDEIALGNADKAIKRASTIDDAAWEIAAAGTLRVSWVKGSGGGNDPECTVFVLGIRVA
jgi:hypothetical protein